MLRFRNHAGMNIHGCFNATGFTQLTDRSSSGFARLHIRAMLCVRGRDAGYVLLCNPCNLGIKGVIMGLQEDMVYDRSAGKNYSA